MTHWQISIINNGFTMKFQVPSTVSTQITLPRDSLDFSVISFSFLIKSFVVTTSFIGTQCMNQWQSAYLVHRKLWVWSIVPRGTTNSKIIGPHWCIISILNPLPSFFHFFLHLALLSLFFTQQEIWLLSKRPKCIKESIKDKMERWLNI